jgi:hypothetical protein
MNYVEFTIGAYIFEFEVKCENICEDGFKNKICRLWLCSAWWLRQSRQATCSVSVGTGDAHTRGDRRQGLIARRHAVMSSFVSNFELFVRSGTGGLTFWERPIVVKRNHYSVKNLLDQIEGCGERAPCTSSAVLQESTKTAPRVRERCHVPMLTRRDLARDPTRHQPPSHSHCLTR